MNPGVILVVIIWQLVTILTKIVSLITTYAEVYTIHEQLCQGSYLWQVDGLLQFPTNKIDCHDIW
jgi:hypothetical protein